MSSQFDIDAQKEFFLGERKALRFRIFEGETQVDIATFNFIFVVRKKDGDPDPALIEKTSGAGISVEGDFSAGEQWGIVLIDAADTATMKKGDYRYSIKRTDAGSETVFPYGKLTLLQATAR